MNTRAIAILFLAVAAVSCEKVKSLAAKVSAAVKEQTAAKGGGTTGTSGGQSNKADPDLRKLVDQTAEGVVFRKDLPFPTRLEVRTTRRDEMTGRVFQSSEIGKGSVPLKGTQRVVSKMDVKDNEVRVTIEKASVTLPAAENQNPEKKDPAKGKPNEPANGKPDEPVEQVAPPEAPVTFIKSGKGWLAKDRRDFHAASLAQKLSPVFDQLLAENAAVPRPLWFAKHRFKVGDPLEVTADSLPMLFAGNAKGSCTLKLESFEAVEGHPCGVLSITGNYHRKIPDFGGNISDENVTIESGKIWCSLLYPVILKQEMNIIQSAKGGGMGGFMSRFQGSAKTSVTHAWKRQDS